MAFIVYVILVLAFTAWLEKKAFKHE